ncbi:MAG: ABC transporter permease [Myxococcota bacterium]
MGARSRLLTSLTLVLLRPQQLSWLDIVRRLDETLVGSLFLVTATVACVGAAMCDQAAAQALRFVGDQSFIGPEYIVLGFEEFGPLVVAITLSARIGAGFAAEVATLTSEQTLDALELFSLRPVETRLAPMGLALVAGGVCLGLVSAVTWELSGMLTMWLRYGMNPFTFFHPEAIQVHSLVLLVVKCACMSGAIFIASLHAGLSARGGAEEVGDATTRAGVQSFLWVLTTNFTLDLAWWFFVRGPS